VQMRAVMIVVRVQTVFGTAEKGWREGGDCWGLENQEQVAECAEKFCLYKWVILDQLQTKCM